MKWYLRIYEAYYLRGIFRQEGPFASKELADQAEREANIGPGGWSLVKGPF